MTDPMGHALLRQRCLALPEVLRETLAAPLPELPEGMRSANRWVVTATGVAEGPARVFAQALRRELGRRAEFVPLSSFVSGDAPPAEAFALFSQALSPNAALALRESERYAHALLVTASPGHPLLARRGGVVVCAHPPADESSLLLRVQGPAASTLMGLRIIQALDRARTSRWDASTAALADVVERAFHDTAAQRTAVDLDAPLAFITLPDGLEAAHGHRWKWLEGPATCDPSCWDVMAFAHGPWQHVCERGYTLVALDVVHHLGRQLLDRLAGMLDPSRHALVRLRATLPQPFAFFEHDAQLNALVCATLPRTTRDLVNWPGRHADRALYDIGL